MAQHHGNGERICRYGCGYIWMLICARPSLPSICSLYVQAEWGMGLGSAWWWLTTTSEHRLQPALQDLAIPRMLSLPSALSIHVTLVLPRKSAVEIPAIMSCIVGVFILLSLDPGHSQAVVWTLNAFFLPVRNWYSLFSYLCPLSAQDISETLRVPTSVCYSTFALCPSHIRTAGLLLGLGFWLWPAISVYARMSECSVPRRVQMVFGNHAPKKHTTRRPRAPARPSPP